MTEDLRNKITGEILDSCIEVHKNLGPGLLESTYEICLLKEFELRNIKAVNQVKLPIEHKAQLITYLKLADKRLGFLINFNVPLLKNGFQRVIQGY